MDILMTDDDYGDRKLVSLALKAALIPHQIEFASNGDDLIIQLKKKTALAKPLPDVILLDLNMPVKDGITTLREIKSNTDLQYIQIIIFSTSASEVDKENSMNSGADRYIVKPLDFIDLIKIMKTIKLQATENCLEEVSLKNISYVK